MNRSKLLILAILMLLIIPSVTAIGVVPASKEIILQDSDTSYDLKVFNQQEESGTFEVEILGELSEYVLVSKNSFVFNQNTKEETIKITLKKPDKFLSGGEYTTRIIIKKTNTDDSQMVAQVGLASKLILTVPYDGASMFTELTAPNFEKGKENSFLVTGFNKGIKTANNCKAIVEIESSSNTASFSIVSPSETINAKSKNKFYLPWKPEFNNGNYIAKASVVCDNTQSSAQAEFMIGSPKISIDSFTANNFELGSINKFDLLLSSNWGEEISGVFADIEVLFDEKSVFTTISESRTIDPFGKSVYPIYMDTTNFEPGKYTVIVNLHYLGKEFAEVFSANMGSNNILINSLSGNVIGNVDDETSGDSQGFGATMNILLIFTILIIVIVNGLLAFKLLKKK